MIKLIALLFLFFSLSAITQIPDYFGNNPTWHCSFWDSDQWNTPAEPYTEDYVYYLNGDTVALGFTYHRVFRKGYLNYENTTPTQDLNFDEQTPYYIRQVGRSIRYFTLANNVDSLLVSYDYSVGDTVQGFVFQLCHSNDTIQKIDSILVNSDYRKVFYLDTLNGPVIAEGIGHQNEITVSSGEFLEQLCAGIGFDYSIHCYGQNLIPLWDSDGNGVNCYLNVDIEKNTNSEFTISPNPAANYFTITAVSEKEFVISIFDLQGNLVLQTSESTVAIDQLVKGFYQVVINDAEGTMQSMKLVVI